MERRPGVWVDPKHRIQYLDLKPIEKYNVPKLRSIADWQGFSASLLKWMDDNVLLSFLDPPGSLSLDSFRKRALEPRVCKIIRKQCGSEAREAIARTNTIKGVFKVLEKIYRPDNLSLLEKSQQLQVLRLHEGGMVETYLRSFIHMAEDLLHCSGGTSDHGQLILTMLQGLPESWIQFRKDLLNNNRIFGPKAIGLRMVANLIRDERTRRVQLQTSRASLSKHAGDVHLPLMTVEGSGTDDKPKATDATRPAGQASSNREQSSNVVLDHVLDTSAEVTKLAEGSSTALKLLPSLRIDEDSDTSGNDDEEEAISVQESTTSINQASSLAIEEDTLGCDRDGEEEAMRLEASSSSVMHMSDEPLDTIDNNEEIVVVEAYSSNAKYTYNATVDGVQDVTNNNEASIIVEASSDITDKSAYVSGSSKYSPNVIVSQTQGMADMQAYGGSVPSEEVLGTVNLHTTTASPYSNSSTTAPTTDETTFSITSADCSDCIVLASTFKTSRTPSASKPIVVPSPVVETPLSSSRKASKAPMLLRDNTEKQKSQVHVVKKYVDKSFFSTTFARTATTRSNSAPRTVSIASSSKVGTTRQCVKALPASSSATASTAVMEDDSVTQTVPQRTDRSTLVASSSECLVTPQRHIRSATNTMAIPTATYSSLKTSGTIGATQKRAVPRSAKTTSSSFRYYDPTKLSRKVASRASKHGFSPAGLQLKSLGRTPTATNICTQFVWSLKDPISDPSSNLASTANGRSLVDLTSSPPLTQEYRTTTPAPTTYHSTPLSDPESISPMVAVFEPSSPPEKPSQEGDWATPITQRDAQVNAPNTEPNLIAVAAKATLLSGSTKATRRPQISMAVLNAMSRHRGLQPKSGPPSLTQNSSEPKDAINAPRIRSETIAQVELSADQTDRASSAVDDLNAPESPAEPIDEAALPVAQPHATQTEKVSSQVISTAQVPSSSPPRAPFTPCPRRDASTSIAATHAKIGNAGALLPSPSSLSISSDDTSNAVQQSGSRKRARTGDLKSAAGPSTKRVRIGEINGQPTITITGLKSLADAIEHLKAASIDSLDLTGLNDVPSTKLADSGSPGRKRRKRRQARREKIRRRRDQIGHA